MTHYHDTEDLGQAGRLRRLAPDGFAAWERLHHNSFGTDEGAIPLTYRELAAVSVPLALQCPYCIGVHVGAAKRPGATEEQLAEAILVASAVGAGAPLDHGALALRLYDGC
jgi:AhpD family alkylhydroperoxidase